jgi:hypothetical protein
VAVTNLIVIPAQAGIQSFCCSNVQITPLRVTFLDELDFPVSLPLLHAFFSGDGVVDTTKTLVVHKSVDTVFPSKTFNKTILVFIYASRQIICKSYVEGVVEKDICSSTAGIVKRKQLRATEDYPICGECGSMAPAIRVLI